MLQVEHGVSTTFHLDKFVTDLDGDPMTFSVETPFDRAGLEAALVAAELPALLADAFSFDPATMTLSYDGRDLGLAIPAEGEPDTVLDLPTGLRLAADDGR